MDNYALRIEISDKEVKQIFDELSEAQETIYDCYNRLKLLGILTVKEKTASGN